ncbi:MAG: DNA-directed RNA polymerase subunit omega [Actinobacteria bacterium]|jgi:DNA-directed RNA polymerase subunit omega|nr:DNA-directed RNA polymerase subunit omega [Actinomycetota bacterium]
MARYTSQRAAAQIGNKFDMVLIAAARARELRRGKRSLLIEDTATPTVTALQEIENGLIGREYLRKLRPQVRKR